MGDSVGSRLESGLRLIYIYMHSVGTVYIYIYERGGHMVGASCKNMEMHMYIVVYPYMHG